MLEAGSCVICGGIGGGRQPLGERSGGTVYVDRVVWECLALPCVVCECGYRWGWALGGSGVECGGPLCVPLNAFGLLFVRCMALSGLFFVLAELGPVANCA